MRYRSSITGRYVTKKYADRHPRITVAEADPEKSEDEKEVEVIDLRTK